MKTTKYLKTLIFAVATCLVLGSVRSSVAATKGAPLAVAAASSVARPLKELALGFERTNGTKVVVSIASTGILAAQIKNGAPFDIFFAADKSFVDDLTAGGFVIPESVEPYAVGRLALAVNKSSGLRVRTLSDLLAPEIKRVAIANPVHAPYGRAAREALTSAGVWEKLKRKLVYGENVRQTMVFIETGNAEAGIVALSMAEADRVTHTTISNTVHAPLDQTAAIIKGSTHVGTALGFLRYVTGPVGTEVMKRYGFDTTENF